MKALVTGAAGFIGSHLVEYLLEQDYEVVAFVRYNSKNSWGWLESIPENSKLTVYSGDIRDLDSVKGSMKEVDVVFHLAALIGIPYSYVSPLAYVKTNIEGTYNVLQSARELGIKRLVHTSTSEIYGTAQYVPIDEKHPINPQSPYAATKSAADQLAISYYRSFGTPVSVIRPFNTFGPRQSARAVIPTIITQLLSGNTTIKLGNLTTTRDMNYVRNTVDGFFKVGLHVNSLGEIINLGSNREISIRDLVKLIGEIMDVKVNIEIDEKRLRPSKSEVERLLCNSEKAYELTGWEPKYTLEEGLKDTINWLKDNLHYFKADIYNV